MMMTEQEIDQEAASLLDDGWHTDIATWQHWAQCAPNADMRAVWLRCADIAAFRAWLDTL